MPMTTAAEAMNRGSPSAVASVVLSYVYLPSSFSDFTNIAEGLATAAMPEDR